MTKFPLRTKRKMATREKLVSAARQLFLSKGYDNTTLEEIAELAGLHVQTLYRHFGTKQDLAKAGDEHWYRAFESAIREKPDTQSTLQFWREWMTTTTEELLEEGEMYRSHLRMRTMSPAILGATIAIRNRYEDLLTNYIAQDFNMSPDGVSIPRLVAGMLLSGNDHARRLYEQGGSDIKDDTEKVVDLTIQLVGHLDRQHAHEDAI